MLTWFGAHHQLTTCVHLETGEKHDCYTGRLAGKKKGWAPREKERGGTVERLQSGGEEFCHDS